MGNCGEDGKKGGGVPRVLPFFSGGAEGSGVAGSFWSVCSGSLMLSSSFSSAMVGLDDAWVLGIGLLKCRVVRCC